MTMPNNLPVAKARSRNAVAPSHRSAHGFQATQFLESMEVVTVVVANDHAMVREGICSVLNHSPGIEVVGHAGNGNEAIELAMQSKPNVAMLDVQMPQLNGIEATERICQSCPDTYVLGISSLNDAVGMKNMFAAGAMGYMMKDASIINMLTAVRTVANGESYLCPSSCRLMIESFMLGQIAQEVSPLAALTPREREVAQLLSEGQSPKEIANQLSVSVKTIDTHRYQVLTKLDLRGIADLTRLAIKEGLSSLESGTQKSDAFLGEKS